MSENSIRIINPYWNGTWVFDDDKVGLVREPFVAGIPEMINAVVGKIPDAKDGFRLLFSETEFPDYDAQITWVRAQTGGNIYKLTKVRQGAVVRAPSKKMEGWLCPALYKYYKDAPKTIYLKAEALEKPPVVMAVYGSLRKWCFNYDNFHLDEEAVPLGNATIAGFDLFDLGRYPGIAHGEGSVFFEVYKVSAKTAASIRRMELSSNYTEETIDTPFGKATVYVRKAGSFDPKRKVESGNWVEHLKANKKDLLSPDMR